MFEKLAIYLFNINNPTVKAMLMGGIFVIMVSILTKIAWGIMRYGSSKKQKQAQAQAPAMRQTQANSQQVFVRKTDLTENMTFPDKRNFEMAETHLARGQVLEAAALFESIKFQRKAIDILEQAKYFDEAAQVLIRLRAFNRAGLLLERNNLFEKAVQVYQQNNLFKEAAQVFKKLAQQKDFRYLVPAAQSYEKAILPKEAVDCYLQVAQYNDALRLLNQSDDFDYLLPYLRDRKSAETLIKGLSAQKQQKLLAFPLLTPLLVHSLVEWIRILREDFPMKLVIPQIVANSMLGVYFFHLCEEPLKIWITEIIMDESAAYKDQLPALSKLLISAGFASGAFLVGVLAEDPALSLNAVRLCREKSQFTNDLKKFKMCRDLDSIDLAALSAGAVDKWVTDTELQIRGTMMKSPKNSHMLAADDLHLKAQ